MNKNSKVAGVTGQLLRTRYFPRKVMTAGDLTTDQEYFCERLRRHNRLLHGCGVVCGLEVVRDPDATDTLCVIITPGYALSPQGDEIHVPDLVKFTIDSAKNLAIDCKNLDAQPEGRRVYLAIQYVEQGVHPAPSLPERCEPTSTYEYSRIRSGFEIACLDYLPGSCNVTEIDCQTVLEHICQRKPPETIGDISPVFACPSETPEPWVILASLWVDHEEGLTIDYAHRLQIYSPQLLELLCSLEHLIYPERKRENEMLKITKTGKIATGATKPVDWQQYPPANPELKRGVFVDVDTSAAGFSKTPTYITAIHGFSSHWDTCGASSVYNASPTGFRIYVEWRDARELTPVGARNLGWHIQWIGVED